MIQQVIFDCDGVLVDTEIVAAEIVVGMLNQLGIDISVQTYMHKYTGDALTSILQRLNVVPDRDQSIMDFAETIERKIYNSLRAINGMPELVRSLSLPVALASNSNIWQVEKAIAFLDIKDKVNTNYFSAEMVERPKPFPDVYLLAARTLDRSPEQCLVIEDSLSGTKSAVGAGMHVIGFCGGSHIQPGHDNRLRELGVDGIAYDASQLRSIISSLTVIQ